MPETPPPDPDVRSAERECEGRSRWHANLVVLAVLLPVWFACSFVCGIFFVEELNDSYSVGEAPLGFWFAHQGSIYVFVVLIFVYAYWMDRIEPVAPTGPSDPGSEGARTGDPK